MKALVTGCAGFIGSNLVDALLEEGYHVTGIECFTDYYPRKIKESNLVKAKEHSKFRLIENNLLSMEKFPDVDYIFHLAAQAGVRASWGNNFEIYTKNNVEATQKLLEYYKDRKIKKLIYSSSSSVYGDVTLPMNENNLLRPISPYGVTKLAAEHLCYLYYKFFDIPTISLRYFTVYGPRQRPDMGIYKFVKAIQSGEKITVYGDGSQTRDFTYISDIVNANILSAENDSIGKVFNIGGGNRINVKELINLIENILGEKAKIDFIEKQKGDVKDTLANIDKAKDVLKWGPEVGIEEGLNHFTDWFNDSKKILLKV